MEYYEYNELWWCDKLREAVKDKETAFIYAPPRRKYAIRYFHAFESPNSVASNYQNRAQTFGGVPVRFCPWCGYRFPPSLHDAWDQRMDDAGIDVFADVALPDDLDSDRWWKSIDSPPADTERRKDISPEGCYDKDGNISSTLNCPVLKT